MLTSGADLSDRENRGRFLSEGKSYIDLAEQVGASFVRVLGDRNPAPAGFVDLSLVRSSYLDLCDYAQGKGVQALIETNGVFADSEVMASFLEGLDHPGAGVLWDIHHPWRFFNETPEETINHIGRHVKYVHIKDSVMKNGKVSYRMLGYGDVPVLDMLKQLNALGYNGYVSLEWVKRWNPDLQEPGVVFSHFTSYMSHLSRAI